MHKYPKVTIGLILHKNEKYLESCLTSLIDQDYPYIEFLIRDQSPDGEVCDYIEKNLPEIFDQLHIEKGENLMHSGGHNALIRQMIRHGGEYYICCSNDMWYPPHFVSGVIKELEKHENRKFGSAACKLMVWDFPLAHPDYPHIDKTDRIDSCGLGITKGHYFYDIGHGEIDKGQYDHKKYIFGASGALAIYRREALEDVAYTPKVRLANRTFFDELIHYKNDVDLAYRLQWAGWPCLFIPEVKVYHDRQASTPFSSGSALMRIIKARKAKGRWVKENSFLGQHVVLMKNYSKKFSIAVRLKTALRKWVMFLFALIFEPYALKQLRILKKNEKEILLKRDAIPRNAAPEVIEKMMN